MSDFLAANNVCGQNLLRLVSRGNAIIAELMRLKDYVPPVFSLDSKQLIQKYGSIIIDFAYFKAASVYEQKIEDDSVLQETDEELRNNFSDILTRFYLAFESIHKYVTDLNFYIDELGDGVYIHQSVDSIMFNEEGKQLMCEAVYLYGVMLLLVDYHFEGRIRERLLVSYYRYNAQRSSSTRVDDVCMLLRSTGYVRTLSKRPANYPEEYFKRVPLRDFLIDLVIGRLRSDEIYNQTLAFPHPEHRSTAVATQASMLVIILSFKSTVLHTQTAIMREIVDRFFPDNWVISIYMGIVISLCDWWSPYKAARTALNNTLENSNVKGIAQKYGAKMNSLTNSLKLTQETDEVQLAGTLDENATGSLVKLVRECNVTLHWILLHTATPTIILEDSKRLRTLRQLVVMESKYTTVKCLRLLLSTAQIEQDVKQMYKDFIATSIYLFVININFFLLTTMASALETPLLRVNQARSADLSSVSQYYSRELEGYARRVLQIIPETVFGLLAEIVHLETNSFKEIPTKLPKDKLKDYAQLAERLQMAKLTYAVSVFTKGVLSLRSVSLGVLRVDSHRLLEDGIRQELVKKVTLALQNGLNFDQKSKTSLLQKLNHLSSIMDGYRKSFQYIQDYININSLKIWHEEITYIINNAVEEERMGSSWVPGKSWRQFQEDKYPFSTDSSSLTFMGRLARELIRITDPRTIVYIEHSLAWYDIKTQNEVLNYKVFSVILETIGTPGLSGLDKLISFFIVIELEALVHYIEKSIRNKTWLSLLEDCETTLNSLDSAKSNITKLHNSINASSSKLWSSALEWALKIGHYQLLRKKIAYELNTACKFEAKHMEAALRTLNTAVLCEIAKKDNINNETEPEKSELLHELSVRLDWAGISDPHNKVYIKPPKIDNIAIIIFLFTVSQLNKLFYCKNTASLLSKKYQDSVDAVVFAIGIQTILRQFHISVMNRYVKYLCMYVLSFVTVERRRINGGNDGDGGDGGGFDASLYLSIALMFVTGSFIIATATKDSKYPHFFKHRTKLREIRGFKPEYISTAIGFGKRDGPAEILSDVSGRDRDLLSILRNLSHIASVDRLLRLMQTNPALADKLMQLSMQNDQSEQGESMTEPSRFGRTFELF
ncbi:WASH complex subunit strumpellin [Atta colombica]|uniref:WASH complex subunit strumpellin n=1 Tax=Atta colombica TaxID=520822 RepID=A0A195BY80_9HYME|nr:WASH complex subunit strumpellin [Atta colombica]